MDGCKYKYKILLVEDMKIAQKIASLRLAELGCDVDTAETGTQALELINKRKYDLIFMDLGLEDMDGLTVTETIRKMEGQGSHVPIVALTAHEAEDIKENCFRVGMNDFLVKPLTVTNGRAILEKYIAK